VLNGRGTRMAPRIQFPVDFRRSNARRFSLINAFVFNLSRQFGWDLRESAILNPRESAGNKTETRQ
jgi:hypothetical protein